MVNYIEQVATLFTKQNEKARPNQVENNASGYGFQLDSFTRLNRWLILGTDGGSYYATEREMTAENARVVETCLNENGLKTVQTIVEISKSGRAPKNAPAIFALAMAAGHDNPETRKAALQALPEVARTGTDLFHFARDVENFRRWGRGLRTAIATWYGEKSPEELGYQAIKYKQRDGWSHRDLLRLSHPKPQHQTQAALYRYIVGGMDAIQQENTRGQPVHAQNLPPLIQAFEEAKRAPKERLLTLVRENHLTHEMLPTAWKNDAAIWEAMLPQMPQTALLRNLGKMTALGLLTPQSTASRLVTTRLTDTERLRRARIHPVSILATLNIYKKGQGERATRRDNALSWSPNSEVVDALNDSFHLAFQTIEPSKQKHLLALDVSSSMASGTIAGFPGLTPRIASAAMAMTTARVEPHHQTVAFASAGMTFGPKNNAGLMPLPISPNQRLDDILDTVNKLPFGGTDCALPMIWAQKNKVEVDKFIIYTDNETWAGEIHPFQALRDYRQKMSRNAKLIVVGMTATAFTIADPNDQNMLDIIGFDPTTPQLLTSF